jgi:hypothetical protein
MALEQGLETLKVDGGDGAFPQPRREAGWRRKAS